jgi:hypothetical protein
MTFRKLDLFLSYGSKDGRFILSWTPWTELVSMPRISYAEAS